MNIPIVIEVKNKLLYKQITLPTCIVGSAKECDIRIKSPFISARHMEFYLNGTRLRARDLKSKNGMSVNGSLFSDIDIIIGDKIEIGDVAIWIDVESLSPAMKRNLSQRRSQRMDQVKKDIDFK